MRNLKRLTALLMAAALSHALSVTAFAAVDDTGFSDVDAGAWYAGAVAYAVDNELMNGTGSTTFSPDADMELSMLITILHRNAGTPNTGTSAPEGVPAGSWYEAAAAWAEETGLLWDIDTSFTNAPLTREDMVTILWRYAGSPVAEGDDFADEAQIALYAAQAVDWSRTAGVVNGKPGNLFDPKGSATRAELAAILQNFLTIGPAASTPEPAPAEGPHILAAHFSAANTLFIL